MGNSQQRQKRQEKLVEKLTNIQIEAELERQRRKKLEGLTFLVLGCKSSGKATLFNQLNYLFGNGWTEQERRQSVYHIRERTFCVLQILQKRAEQKRRTKLTNQIQELVAFVETLLQVRRHSEDKSADIQITEEEKEHNEVQYILSIFELEAIQQLLEEEEDNLDDGDLYYMQKLSVIWAKDYFPSYHDMIRLNVPFRGVREIEIEHRSAKYRFVDPGGAVGGCICCTEMEPRKWLHHFEEVTALVYCADLCAYRKLKTPPARIYSSLQDALPDVLIAIVIEYASPLPKHDNVQALCDLDVLEGVCNSRWFKNVYHVQVLLTNVTRAKDHAVEDLYFPDCYFDASREKSWRVFVETIEDMYHRTARFHTCRYHYCNCSLVDTYDSRQCLHMLNNILDTAKQYFWRQQAQLLVS